MIDEIAKLIDEYVKWLRDKTHYRQITDWVEITTPFLNSDNDYIQIYARKHNGGFLLTDDGYTIDDLELHGLKLESPKRLDLLKMTLNGFGVKEQNGELTVFASPENFPIRKHNLIQAILSVNDMFHLSAPRVASLFKEDVVAWLDLNDIRYTPEIKFTGKSGFDHLFDFVIAKSRQRPFDRILRAINRPDRDSAQLLAFAWGDIREVRPPQSQAYAILNDSEQRVSVSVLDALKSYEVRPILWSDREQAREELAA